MFAEAKVEKHGNQLVITHGDDKECYVEFRKEPIKQEAESERQGRPIFKDIDFIRIQFPGDKTKVVDRPVTDFDKQRFPNQWRSFEETGAVVHEGTPINEWPPLTKSQALEFKGMGIHTVEQLANIGDHLLTFFGARNYRDEAKTFLEKSKGADSQIAKLQAQMAELMAANAAHAQANAELMARLNQAPEETPKVRKPRGPNKPKAVESTNP